VNGTGTNTKNTNIRYLHRDINEFRKGYEPGIGSFKDENGDPFADCHNIWNRLILSATESAMG
jgi:hypothetical protein